MTLKNLSIFIIQLVFLLGILTGCSRFATTGKMMDRIEKQATQAITEQEFIKKVRIARLVGEEGSKKVYLVAFGEPCFICSSAKAHLQSFEPYATKFIFENGNLLSIKRIVDGS